MPTKKLSLYTINKITQIKAEQRLNPPKKRRVRRVKKECLGCGDRKYLIDFNKTRRWHENTCKECRAKRKRNNYKKKVIITKIAGMAWI